MVVSGLKRIKMKLPTKWLPHKNHGLINPIDTTFYLESKITNMCNISNYVVPEKIGQ